MRALVRRTQEVRRFEPRDDLDWAGAESRLPFEPAPKRDGVSA
jgi:hypothetical protein